MNSEDETSVTEITITPDGRVYVFGASRSVLELLDDLQLGDPTISERAQHVKSRVRTLD